MAYPYDPALCRSRFRVRPAPFAVNCPPWLRLEVGHLTLEVAVHPGVSRSKIQRIDERGLVIGVAAPPERGRANDELARLISRIARTPRSAVSILRGGGARRKTVRVETADPESCAKALLDLANQKRK